MKYFLRLTLVIFLFGACQKEVNFPPGNAEQVTIVNPGFEESLKGWTIEADPSWYGFSADTGARVTGLYGLNFYVAQSHHFAGAPQETPWNGKITQTVTELKNGMYTFKAHADAVGSGMFLTANGVQVKIKSDINEVNTVDFEVKDGTATIGFICVNANGPELYAPYFHADDVELWTKE
jgi:hypothetical protein